MSDLALIEPLLVPQPAHLERRSGPGLLGISEEHLDAALPDEAYRLTVDHRGATTTAGGGAGLQRARATLAQLRVQYGAQGPALVIDDFPAFGERGYMLDVSRDRVPTVGTLERHVRLLADLKLNHFELYTEHTFAYPGHEDVWGAASPITAAEVQVLDAACAAESIRLAANQNCFGHLERWLKHPRHAALAETHERFEFEGIELTGPFSLCPTDPASLTLVAELLDALLPNFSSGVVHIGCDETQDVGQGRSREAVAERGLFEVYRDHIAAVAAIAERHRCEPRFWADIALKFPERLAELPDALIPVAWGYDPSHPFDAQASVLAGTGRPFHLCCGTSGWRSFVGRTTERRANLEACLDAGRTHGARGVQIAEWGDVGHRQVEAIGWLALAEFAARAWNPDAPVDDRAVSLHVFGDRQLAVAAWLAELGDVDRDLRVVGGIPADDGSPRPLANASALFERLHPSGFPFRLPTDRRRWAAVLERLDDLRARRPTLDAKLAAELDHALDQATLAARVGAGHPPDGLLDHVRAEHRRLWLATSRPGGLEDSLAHWSGAET